MRITKYNDEDYSVLDGVYGIVTGGCDKGIFIKLENGQNAYAKFGARIGQRVMCTIRGKAAGAWRVFVTIDSVLDVESAIA